MGSNPTLPAAIEGEHGLSGAFIWYELMSPDPAAAAAFYGRVLGWQPRGVGAFPDYTILAAGPHDVAGLMPVPEGAQPGWVGYVSTADLDASLAAMAADGAAVLAPAMAIPGVGRIGVIADPQGAVLCLLQPEDGGESHAFRAKAPGHCNWNELATGDPADALGFLGRHFGWHRAGAMPMGAAGEYAFLAAGGAPFGAVMPLLEPGQGPGWRFYWGVPALAPAIAAIEAAGGAILHGPQEVPGEDEIVIARDPQGVVFALVAPVPAPRA